MRLLNRFLLLLCLCVPVTGAFGETFFSDPAAAAAKKYRPIYLIPLRVHTSKTQLSAATLKVVFTEVNKIWLTQGSIFFDVEFSPAEAIRTDGFDLWVDVQKQSYNGIYRGQHDIWVNDQPGLGNSPDPVGNSTARTAAHELGHALGQAHYNGYANSNVNLMSSGNKGWGILDSQITISRNIAATRKSIGATVFTGSTSLVFAPAAAASPRAEALVGGMALWAVPDGGRAWKLFDARGRLSGVSPRTRP